LSLRVYNTLTRKKEEFVPLEHKEVKAYVCGVTLYDELHLGHARYAVVFDIIRRYLEYKGYKVNYITNFTDIDDKMIARAQSLGVSISELAEKFIREYFAQMQQLGVKKADCHPRATEHIKEIIELIKKLEDRGLAYSTEGDVFFRVKRFPSYGKLSHQNLEDILTGVRVEVDEKKENPFDFALWKKSKENEPSWDSPWGKGRPGWHIECSAMAMRYLGENLDIHGGVRYLGENLDIHGGGKDLIFPHHENEIAQSEGATGKIFVRYWLHNGLVRMKNAKMAKSTGNVLTLSHALRNYEGEVVRYFLLSAHYRSSLDYSQNSLRKAFTSLERIYNTLGKIEELEEEYKKGLLEDSSTPSVMIKAKASDLFNYSKEAEDKLAEALDDDFNVPIALSVIFKLARKANLLLNEKKYLDDSSFQILLKAYQKIKALGNILGLLQRKEEKKLEGKEEQLIELLVNTRDTLREKKEWELADKIRKGLDKLGIKLEDKEDRTAWRVN
jgi:cysteinyl-tRNA synthetase